MHKRRLRMHGSLDGGTHYGEAEKFYQEVVLTYEGTDCLIWPFARGGRGYGNMKFDGRAVLVHRRACEEINGPPPTPEHEAAHHCGNGEGGCVNVHHVRWATHVENMADKLIHDTHNRGERNGLAKLTEPDIPVIRSLLGTATYAEIGDRFGVSAATIWQIDKGNAWGWLR